MKLVLAIALGGAVGAVGRHFVAARVAHWLGAGFPWGTLTVNVAGSLVLGLLVGILTHSWSPSVELRGFLVVGTLGAFTTFSSFSLDAILLMERGEPALAAAYMGFSVLLAVSGLYAGLRAATAILGS
jgi:CrcB protein